MEDRGLWRSLDFPSTPLFRVEEMVGLIGDGSSSKVVGDGFFQRARFSGPLVLSSGVCETFTTHSTRFFPHREGLENQLH